MLIASHNIVKVSPFVIVPAGTTGLDVSRSVLSRFESFVQLLPDSLRQNLSQYGQIRASSLLPCHQVVIVESVRNIPADFINTGARFVSLALDLQGARPYWYDFFKQSGFPPDMLDECFEYQSLEGMQHETGPGFVVATINQEELYSALTQSVDAARKGIEQLALVGIPVTDAEVKIAIILSGLGATGAVTLLQVCEWALEMNEAPPIIALILGPRTGSTNQNGLANLASLILMLQSRLAQRRLRLYPIFVDQGPRHEAIEEVADWIALLAFTEGGNEEWRALLNVIPSTGQIREQNDPKTAWLTVMSWTKLRKPVAEWERMHKAKIVWEFLQQQLNLNSSVAGVATSVISEWAQHLRGYIRNVASFGTTSPEAYAQELMWRYTDMPGASQELEGAITNRMPQIRHEILRDILSDLKREIESLPIGAQYMVIQTEMDALSTLDVALSEFSEEMAQRADEESTQSEYYRFLHQHTDADWRHHAARALAFRAQERIAQELRGIVIELRDHLSNMLAEAYKIMNHMMQAARLAEHEYHRAQSAYTDAVPARALPIETSPMLIGGSGSQTEAIKVAWRHLTHELQQLLRNGISNSPEEIFRALLEAAGALLCAAEPVLDGSLDGTLQQHLQASRCPESVNPYAITAPSNNNHPNRVTIVEATKESIERAVRLVGDNAISIETPDAYSVTVRQFVVVSPGMLREFHDWLLVWRNHPNRIFHTHEPHRIEEYEKMMQLFLGAEAKVGDSR